MVLCKFNNDRAISVADVESLQQQQKLQNLYVGG